MDSLEAIMSVSSKNLCYFVTFLPRDAAMLARSWES